MSQIRPKQIRLNNQGDLIVGSDTNSGSILSRGSQDQVLHVVGSSIQWSWTSRLYDSTGILTVQAINSPGAVNYFTVTGAASGSAPVLAAEGTDADIDLVLSPKGTGEILAPVGYTVNIASNNALVTKEYVDALSTGLDWKNSVKVATASSSDLAGFTYNASNEPAGLVWTNVTSPTFDGVTINDGDRVLIKDATDQRGNGIFVYDQANSAFIRAEDANSSSEVSKGLAVFVEQGAVHSNTAWVMTQPNGNANLGTDNLVFTQFAGTNLYIAGSGLSLVGNVFKANESTTIGVDSLNNLVVRSNNLAGNVLISTGTPGQEAAWGQLNLSNPNSVTGELGVNNGGTGLSSVPAGHLLVGNGTLPLQTIAPTPASNSSTVYVLQTNNSGTNVVFGTVSLNQLSDVSAPSPSAGQLLQYDGTEWVLVNSSALQTDDKYVKITANDDTAGYLNDKLAVSGVIVKTVLSAGAGERLELTIVTDNTTIIQNGGALSVGGGTSAQVLIGNGSASPAIWLSPNNLLDYQDLVYDPTLGRPTFRGRREIAYWRVSATPGPIIGGTINGINNTLEFNDGIGTKPSGGVSGSFFQLKYDIAYLSSQHTPMTLALDDVFMVFDASNAYSFNYTTVSAFISNLNLMSVSTSGLVVSVGGSAVTRLVVANTSADRQGIEILNGDGQNGDITVGLDITNLSAGTANEASDIIVFNPATQSNEKVALSAVLSLNVSANYKWYGITDGVNTLTPDSSTDTLTVTGSGIALTFNAATDQIEFALDIPFLVPVTPASQADVASYEIAVFDGSSHARTRLGAAIAEFTKELYASANAVGVADETFVNFFNTNVIPETVTVYFNGIALKRGGWTITGTDLSLVDSVNGYSTEPGDVITATYRVSQ